MLKMRLQTKFLFWGLIFGAAGGLAGGVVHAIVMHAGWEFPWDYLITIPVLIGVWLLPLGTALNHWVLRPVARVVEANRKVAAGDETGMFLPPEAIPDHEIGDIMRSRNEMVARLQEARQQMEQRAERLVLLHELSAVVSESMLVDTVFDTVVQQALTVAGMDSAAVFVRDDEVLTLVAQGGLTSEVEAGIRQHHVGEDLPGLVAATGEVLTIEAAVSRDPRVQVEPIRQAGYESFVGVPLKSQGRVIGVLALGAFQARSFAEADLSFLQTVGDVVGTAVANGRLYAEVRDHVRRLEQFHRTARELLAAFGQPLDKEALLQRALGFLSQSLRSRYAAVGLGDEAGQLTQFVHWGMTEEEVARIGSPPAGTGLLGALLQGEEVIRLEDLTQDPRHIGFPPYHPPMKTFLGVPIASRRQVYGRLYLTEKEGGQPFTEEDASLASNFANSLALALENLRLLEQTQEAETRYRDLYEHAPDGLDEVNPEGLIVSMNQTLLDWLGYTQEEVVGKMRYDQLLTEEGRRQFLDVEERCRREGRVEGVEVELVRKDGSRLPVRINAIAVYDEEGHYLGCRGTTWNVTREKELERQLFQAQKMEAIGTLAGGIAHDFNNLLQGMMGWAELSRPYLEEGSRAGEMLAYVEELGQRAAMLIKQLLAFSRKTVLERRPFDLNLLVKETAQLLRRTLPEMISVQARTASEPAVVEADLAQMQQVLLNLATNARDAMPEGGTLTLTVSRVTLDEEYLRRYPYARPGEHVCLSAQDTGTGIAPELLDRIFEPFVTTKEAGKGTGLGLAMVYGTVKQHGGHINVYSEVGQGTEFKVYLPAVRPTTEEKQRVQEAAPRGQGETVLLVEDEEQVRAVGQAMLEQLGYTVLTAANGVEALESYRERGAEIALVMTDMVMPQMGGRELYAALREINPEVKVLLISGYSLDAEVEQLRAEGLAGFLSKPLRLNEWARAVRATLEEQ